MTEKGKTAMETYDANYRSPLLLVEPQEVRGTGRTYRQLKAMAHGGLFVWCTSDVSHCAALLAEMMDRPGRINVVPIGVVHRMETLRGMWFPEVVWDHAINLEHPLVAVAVRQLALQVR